MTKDGSNKTALITGTSSGFGKATARLFVNNGWNVVATMRRPEAEKDLARRSVRAADDLIILRQQVCARGFFGVAILRARLPKHHGENRRAWRCRQHQFWKKKWCRGRTQRFIKGLRRLCR